MDETKRPNQNNTETASKPNPYAKKSDFAPKGPKHFKYTLRNKDPIITKNEPLGQTGLSSLGILSIGPAVFISELEDIKKQNAENTNQNAKILRVLSIPEESSLQYDKWINNGTKDNYDFIERHSLGLYDHSMVKAETGKLISFKEIGEEMKWVWDNLQKPNNEVRIHCNAGEGRSSAFVQMFLAYCGYSLEAATQIMRQRSPAKYFGLIPGAKTQYKLVPHELGMIGAFRLYSYYQTDPLKQAKSKLPEPIRKAQNESFKLLLEQLRSLKSTDEKDEKIEAEFASALFIDYGKMQPDEQKLFTDSFMFAREKILEATRIDIFDNLRRTITSPIQKTNLAILYSQLANKQNNIWSTYSKKIASDSLKAIPKDPHDEIKGGPAREQSRYFSDQSKVELVKLADKNDCEALFPRIIARIEEPQAFANLFIELENKLKVNKSISSEFATRALEDPGLASKIPPDHKSHLIEGMCTVIKGSKSLDQKIFYIENLLKIDGIIIPIAEINGLTQNVHTAAQKGFLARFFARLGLGTDTKLTSAQIKTLEALNARKQPPQPNATHGKQSQVSSTAHVEDTLGVPTLNIQNEPKTNLTATAPKKDQSGTPIFQQSKSQQSSTPS
jgi:hypothetical protein